jgi:excisionase family DNA binding protein
MHQLEPIISARELAEYLDVPVATIYAWRYRRQGPPAFRVGRYVRFRWSDVERWIEDRIAQTCHT